MFETTSFSLPLAIILIPYGLFLLFILLYSSFTLYHLLRFGVLSRQLIIVIATYIIGCLFILIISGSFLLTFDWDTPLTFTEFTQEVPTFSL